MAREKKATFRDAQVLARARAARRKTTPTTAPETQLGRGALPAREMTMKTKKEIRYGKHEFTTVEASWPETGEPTKRHTILWSSENNIAQAHGQLRRAIKRAMRELTEADDRLEANALGDLSKPRTLLIGINTLGILQSAADDVDNNVRALDSAIDAHVLLASAINTDVNEPAT